MLLVMLSTTAFSQLAEKGAIYASTYEGDIYKLSDDFKSRSLVLSTEFEKIAAMAIDSSGRVFVSDQFRLYELDLSNGNSNYLASLPDSLHVLDYMGTLAFDQNNQLYAIKSGTNGCGAAFLVYSYNFEQKEFKKWFGYGSSCPDGDAFTAMAFDPRTNIAYGLIRGSGELFRFDVDIEPVPPGINSERVVVSKGILSGYSWLLFGPKGDFYAFQEGQMVSISKTDGQVIQTTTGNFEYSAVATRLPLGRDIVSGVDDAAEASLIVYPNPATEEVVFAVYAKNGGLPRIEIVNSLGKIVHEEKQNFAAPSTHVSWNLHDFSGIKLSAGIYFARLIVGNKVVEVKKMLVLK